MENGRCKSANDVTNFVINAVMNAVIGGAMNRRLLMPIFNVVMN